MGRRNMTKLENWILVDDQHNNMLSQNTHWVEVIAHIRHNETQEIRRYRTEMIFFEDDEKYPLTFIWSEGNYSCDCNRKLFFEYVNGKKYEDIDHPCSDGQYSVNLENPKTGEIFYKEY